MLLDDFFCGDELESNDPYSHMLAWNFILINKHQQTELANKIQRCVDSLHASCSIDDVVLKNILLVLFKLKKLPENNNVVSCIVLISNELRFVWLMF